MIKVTEISSHADLALFSQYLTEQGVKHRFTQEGLKQVLWVETESAAIFAREAFVNYQVGELQINIPVKQGLSLFPHLRAAVRSFPLTLSLIALNILFFELGAEVLKNAEGFLAASPDKAVQSIRNQLAKAISDVRKGGDLEKLGGTADGEWAEREREGVRSGV